MFVQNLKINVILFLINIYKYLEELVYFQDIVSVNKKVIWDYFLDQFFMLCIDVVSYFIVINIMM